LPITTKLHTENEDMCVHPPKEDPGSHCCGDASPSFGFESQNLLYLSKQCECKCVCRAHNKCSCVGTALIMLLYARSV
jgi:hypothetical protein